MNVKAVAITAIDIYSSVTPDVEVPGYPFVIKEERKITSDAPKIFQHSQEAGPDETFFVVGEGLTKDVVVWGMSDTSKTGQEWKARVQFCNGQYLTATLPESCYDGVFVVWIRSENGYSKPFLLNAPKLWWTTPDKASPGDEVSLFGRNLARLPDFNRSFVYTQNLETKSGQWLKVRECSKYRLKVQLPSELSAGKYSFWCHIGVSGEFGWSNAFQMAVEAKSPNGRRRSCNRYGFVDSSPRFSSLDLRLCR